MGGLHKPGEDRVDRPDAGIGAAPLHEDRALILAFDNGAVSIGFVGDEQADRAFHPEEARGRHGDRPREHALDDRFLESQQIDELVERPDHVVLRVVECLGWN